ncbi:hypothetical protein SLA2020_073410 [Shorea laevis]
MKQHQGQPEIATRDESRDIAVLAPGDHIYTARRGGSYSHHGIYVGDDMVIHLQPPRQSYAKSSKKISSCSVECKKCGYKPDCDTEIIKTCLDCFLDGGSLCLYEYGVSDFRNKPSGSCSPSTASRTGDEVVMVAHNLLETGSFGGYNFASNNCEDFAVFCKTGMGLSMQALEGFQAAASFLGAEDEIGGLALYGAAKAIHAGINMIRKQTTLN